MLSLFPSSPTPTCPYSCVCASSRTLGKPEAAESGSPRRSERCTMIGALCAGIRDPYMRFKLFASSPRAIRHGRVQELKEVQAQQWGTVTRQRVNPSSIVTSAQGSRHLRKVDLRQVVRARKYSWPVRSRLCPPNDGAVSRRLPGGAILCSDRITQSYESVGKPRLGSTRLAILSTVLTAIRSMHDESQ